ncbi:hypothetical protein GCK72_018303 [Caenorhabditis remanei]|uniref:Uncharacterized protein n=1 Tax=Caenorhabditis remanei TaxID=31234 RepID=A0A6A5GBH3_CAERE|nr:hypothetical protein GCK72_018303 [Caenorhabditis remanei]KAF1751749.1 hypothetical protein GCK72_018303 [Caenorhabditis remanei]
MCYLLLLYHFLIKTGLSMSGQWGFRLETNQQSDVSEGQIDTTPYPAGNLEGCQQHLATEAHILRNVEYQIPGRGSQNNEYSHNMLLTSLQQRQQQVSPSQTQHFRDAEYNASRREGFPTEQTVPVVPQRSEFDILQERMREENERAEREHEEKMKKRREERARKKELLEKEVSNEMKQIELNEQRRARETQIKLENERKELERELLNDTIQKEEKYQNEIENLKKHGEQELEEMKKQRQREKLIHEKVVNDKDEEFLKISIRQQKEAEAMNDELARLQAEHNERIGQIYIELEKEKEEMQRKHKIRMDQMKQQWDQIKMMFQYKIWNEVIERNWANRLNALRSSTKKIVELFNRFYNNAREMQRHIGNPELFIKEKQKCIPMLNALIEAITPEIDMLTEESENLNIQWNNTGKHFVFCIKESVEKVTYACKQFGNALKDYLDYLEKNDCDSSEERSLHLKLVKKRYDSLSKYSNEIPTLAELKQNNSDEMKQEQTANMHHQDVIPTQSVIIEEIE